MTATIFFVFHFLYICSLTLTPAHILNPVLQWKLYFAASIQKKNKKHLVEMDVSEWCVCAGEGDIKV